METRRYNANINNTVRIVCALPKLTRVATEQSISLLGFAYSQARCDRTLDSEDSAEAACATVSHGDPGVLTESSITFNFYLKKKIWWKALVWQLDPLLDISANRLLADSSYSLPGSSFFTSELRAFRDLNSTHKATQSIIQ